MDPARPLAANAPRGDASARGASEFVLGAAVLWVGLAALVWWARGSLHFADRDDGIITLAHARHFVDFGSVTVTRFGDRVNGFSAPLHLLVSIAYFLLGDTGYALRHPARSADLVLASELRRGMVPLDPAFLDPCREPHDAEDCLVRMRAARRAFPGVRSARDLRPLLDGVDVTPAGRLARALIESPITPGWPDAAMAALVDLDADASDGHGL